MNIVWLFSWNLVRFFFCWTWSWHSSNFWADKGILNPTKQIYFTILFFTAFRLHSSASFTLNPHPCVCVCACVHVCQSEEPPFSLHLPTYLLQLLTYHGLSFWVLITVLCFDMDSNEREKDLAPQNDCAFCNFRSSATCWLLFVVVALPGPAESYYWGEQINRAGLRLGHDWTLCSESEKMMGSLWPLNQFHANLNGTVSILCFWASYD